VKRLRPLLAAAVLLALGAGAGALATGFSAPGTAPSGDEAAPGTVPPGGSTGAGGGSCPGCGPLVPEAPALPDDLAAAALLLTLGAALLAWHRTGRPADAAATGSTADDRAVAGGAPSASPSRGRVAADNEVYRAWAAMARRAGVAEPDTATPREVAAAATDAGVDPGTARALTELFGAVRYGGRPVTEGRRRRASALRDAVEGRR
jgi:hypothetical protein